MAYYTVAEHDERFSHMLDQLVKYNAIVLQDKCVIGVPEVDFKDHRLTPACIRPLTSNVDRGNPNDTDQRLLYCSFALAFQLQSTNVDEGMPPMYIVY